MTTLYITEFARVAPPANVGGQAPVAMVPPVAEQSVAIGGASVQSAVIGNNTRLVRLHAAAACHIQVGANPTATTSHLKMAAGATEYFGIEPGVKIAAIAGA